MKIAYTFHRDAANVTVQSNRPASILREFRAAGLQIEEFFPLQTKPTKRITPRKIYHRILGKLHRLDRDEHYLREMANEFSVQSKNKKFDLVFSPGSEVITHLKTNRPITFCADATFANLVDYYWDFTNLSATYLEKGHAQERRALSRAALAIYPTEWAAKSAIDCYGADPEKVAVIEFGANLGHDNSAAAVKEWIKQRPKDRMNLLFVGRHWQRKGGDIAVEAVRLLRNSGISAELDVVGCDLPAEFQNLAWVHGHGSLQLDNPAEAERLGSLFSRAHFLIVPSRAEAYGMIFCEANAFGVPAVSCATGGIPTIIRDGQNGLLLPKNAPPEAYAAAIGATFADQRGYTALCRQSFAEFERRLNWKTFVSRFLETVKTRIPEFQTKQPSNTLSRATKPISIGGRPIRAAYVVTKFLDPGSSKSWSGLPYNMMKSLETAGIEFVQESPLKETGIWLRMVRFLAWRYLGRKRFLRNSDATYLKDLAKQASERLKDNNVDIVFAPSTWSISYLETSLPIVFWTDSTFAGVLGFYKSFENLAPPSIRDAEGAELAAVQRCTRAIYSSDWAAQSAIKDYGIAPGKVAVVPFGANMDALPGVEEVKAYIAAKPKDFCELLLVGVEWERKGASIAIDTFLALKKRNFQTRLTIVGCTPPAGTIIPEGVEVIAFIAKKTREGRKLLFDLFARTHFFLMPTRADCTPVVYSEANSFGIPCLTTDVGGIPTIVRNGINGQLFPLSATGADYAEAIVNLMQCQKDYRKLALRSKVEADTRLSWGVSGRKVAEILRDVILESTKNQRATT